MHQEKIKWNKKYKTLTPKPPSPLMEYIPSKKGKALDLAGGLGRNAKVLLNKGYNVTLIDISDVAISKITLPVKTLRLDLDNYIIPQNEFDVIIMIKYFNLDLLKQISNTNSKIFNNFDIITIWEY